MQTQLEKFFQERQDPDWQPLEPFAPVVTNDPAIYRMLEFLDLEVTVGNWVTESLAKSGLSEAIPFVTRNAKDEEKHDKQLRYLWAALGRPEPSQESQALVKEWQSQEPSFALAYALEMGIFMSILPYLNSRSKNQYISWISQKISDDERNHIAVNGYLAKQLGQAIDVKVLNLVLKTVSYIFQPPTEEGKMKLYQRTWRRLQTGEDAAMASESTTTHTAFFEQGNKQHAENLYS